MCRSSNEKCIKHHKNTLPAGYKNSLNICEKFNKHKMDMCFALEFPTFPRYVQVSSIKENKRPTMQGLHLALKCHLDDVLSFLVDLHVLSKRTKNYH